MAFQKSKAKLFPEAFDLMNFDTRMKASFENSYKSQVIIAKDKDIPIGYVFSTIDDVQASARTQFPQWAPKGEGVLGFYPDWVKLPQKIGCLNNLYIRDEYRGTGLGYKLTRMAMDWLENSPEINLIFVFISNGNDQALNFYLNLGFTYSHEVFGGFIKAAYKKL